MKLLLDSHVLLWFSDGLDRIGKQTYKVLESSDNTLCLSYVSIFELCVKSATKSIYFASPSSEWLEQRGVQLLTNIEMFKHYKIFNMANKDPFDNALIATALAEDCILVTADEAILDTKVKGLKLMDARI